MSDSVNPSHRVVGSINGCLHAEDVAGTYVGSIIDGEPVPLEREENWVVVDSLRTACASRVICRQLVTSPAFGEQSLPPR